MHDDDTSVTFPWMTRFATSPYRVSCPPEEPSDDDEEIESYARNLGRKGSLAILRAVALGCAGLVVGLVTLRPSPRPAAAAADQLDTRHAQARVAIHAARD